ncbi:hypothetical protein [Candidatus Synchoanobacter obligatus]|uniref:DUF4426 domain-containing protein n=1 Tax=Candidatus Synchoanobacter obligatus TaxID=2919597 RepID=A0ABT1L549_9GAMM|nr:hypothetical protein [Candidatus Synchoanobacter obligatus]MCP8351993.1 hypothetical protein [Candidatus Synchoanobacter obligatus]
MKRHKLLIWLFITPLWALNPMQEWSKPFPSQHLVTRQSPATPNTPEPPEPPEPTVAVTYNYEDIIVFGLTATVAAFHVNPETFLEDHERLNKYFEPQALQQINQKLFPGSGQGLLDHCILSQTSCDAITHDVVQILQEAPHYIELKLPIKLNNQQKTNVIIAIQRQPDQPLRITDFTLEEEQ